MTRFIYIADTHVGAAKEGYHQQPCYAEHLPALLRSLDNWIQRHPGIDFVLHGGDMVDQVSVDSVKTARSWFALSVPVYLCLGNHDMTHPDAGAIWLGEAPDFFIKESLNFNIPGDAGQIHVMPNHWCETPVYWDGQHLSPRFATEQLAYFDKLETTGMGLTHLICMHSELAAVPTAQTGFKEPYHQPSPAFASPLLDFIQKNRNIRCFLSGHNHINSCVPLRDSGAYAVTVSAFTETPFEFKVVDWHYDSITMRTENLLSECGFQADYDYNKTFVQGRLKDRTFEINLRE
jgi:hypothetical protein